MKCNNCGYENSEGSSFCQECGSKLVAPEVINNEEVTPVEEETPLEVPIKDAVSPEPVVNSQPIQEEPPKKKKSKLPLVIVLVILVLALIGAAATFGKELLFKTDEEKLIEASIKTSEARQKAVVGEIGFEEFMVDGVGVMEAAVIENLVKGLNVNYKILSDADAIKVEGNLGVMMNGSELMDITFHLNKEYIAIGVPALYDRVIYLNWEDVQKVMIKYELVSEEEMPDIDTERVIELIEAYAVALDYESYDAYKDVDTAKYEELTYGYLTGSMISADKGSLEFEAAGEDLVYDGQLYRFDIDMEEYMNLSTNLVDAVMEDENLVPMLIEGITRVIATTIEQEDIYVYNVLNQSMTYGDTVLAWNPSFEDELNDMKEDMIKEIEDGYEEAMEEMEMAFEEDEYNEMMEAMKDIYSEIEVESDLIINNGYIMGSESFVTIDDSIVDAINDSPMLSEMMGYELAEFNEMGILFKVKTYQRMGVLQIDEVIEFDGLPSSARDFSELDEMELYEIYQEIMINAEELSSGLMGGF